jgi:hypothetical protein
MNNKNTPNPHAGKPLAFVVNPGLNLDKQLLVLLFSVLIIAFMAQLNAAIGSGVVSAASHAQRLNQAHHAPNAAGNPLEIVTKD